MSTHSLSSPLVLTWSMTARGSVEDCLLHALFSARASFSESTVSTMYSPGTSVSTGQPQPWNHQQLQSEDFKTTKHDTSTDFSLKMQPKPLLPPTSSRGLITVTVSSWVHPILSSNLSRKFKTMLQDSFSWHLVITTRHLSWKSCTGFPFQSALNTKLHACASML